MYDYVVLLLTKDDRIVLAGWQVTCAKHSIFKPLHSARDRSK